MSCGFEGNADIYGIGIRIGYYTQALAVWFSCYFLHSEVKGLRAVNNLFLLALCIAATIYIANASSTFVIEAFLMLQIGLVIGLVGITERSRYSSKYVKNSKERIILRMVIIMAGSLFNVCFWWKALDAMLPTPCSNGELRTSDRDSTYFFYIFKTSIYGWAGVLMKVQSIAAVVWSAPRIITFDAIVLFYDFRLRKTRAAFIKAVDNSGLPSKEKLNISKSSTVDANENIKLLKGIDNAIEYLENLFSIFPAGANAKEKKQNERLSGGLKQFRSLKAKCTCTGTPAPYTQCLNVFFKSHFTNKPLFDLRWRIELYMKSSGQHPSLLWPSVVHRILVLGEACQPPGWRHVAIAADILLTQIPVVVKRRTWILGAAWQFYLIVILVLQVELTIAWNHISGLQSFSPLGQLIPFILGVGGLLKVIWGKWTLVRKGIPEKDSEHNGAYEDAMAKFLEGRKKLVEQSLVRAATA